MARTLVALLAGLVFGIGLVVSQMVAPAKVLGFLDVFGNWDPSLAFVMGGAILVSLVGVASFGAATAASYALSGLVDWTLAAFFVTGGLPGGSAEALWNSIQRILALPAVTRVFTGHDYQPGGSEPHWESTVDEQRRTNVHLVKAPTKEAFVALREARDHDLAMPNLILHVLQVNIRGGRLPEPEDDGRRYLKIPLDALEGAAW